MDSFDLDAIWEDAQSQYDIIKQESKESVKNTDECNHAIKTLDTVTSDLVCSTCGAVVGRDSGQSVEWSKYKDGGLQGHILYVTVNYSLNNNDEEDSVALSFTNDNFNNEV